MVDKLVWGLALTIELVVAIFGFILMVALVSWFVDRRNRIHAWNEYKKQRRK